MRIGQRFRQLLVDIENEAALAVPSLAVVKLSLEPDEIEALAVHHFSWDRDFKNFRSQI